jgi:hypothetical protein
VAAADLAVTARLRVAELSVELRHDTQPRVQREAVQGGDRLEQVWVPQQGRRPRLRAGRLCRGQGVRHLFDLARTANTSAAARTRRRPARHVRTEVLRLLDAMTMAPAYVRNGRLDVRYLNGYVCAYIAPRSTANARPTPPTR